MDPDILEHGFAEEDKDTESAHGKTAESIPATGAKTLEKVLVSSNGLARDNSTEAGLTISNTDLDSLLTSMAFQEMENGKMEREPGGLDQLTMANTTI